MRLMSKKSVNRHNVKAIILAGSRDFGRCPLASRLPTALWPVAGKPVLECLLTSLADQGIKQVTICSNSESSLLAESIYADKHLELKFLDEQLPAGTAGSIRDAAGDEKDALDSRPHSCLRQEDVGAGTLLVFSANIISPPKIDVLIKAHRDGQCDLTVMFNPGWGNDKSQGEPAGIYTCETSILEHIPKAGYFDIKEGLISEMLCAGKTVHAATLPNHVGNFRDWQGYLRAIGSYLESTARLNLDLKPFKRNGSQNVWMAADAKVEPGARIYGPVVIMDGACIEKDTVILGPTILGNNVSIGKGSVVVNSVLWDDAQVGPNCQIQRCIVDYHAALRDNTVVEEESISFKPEGILKRSASQALKVSQNNAGRLQEALQLQVGKINEKLPDWVQSRKTKIVPWLSSAGHQVVRTILYVWLSRKTIHCSEYCCIGAASVWLAASAKGIYGIIVPMFDASLA